MNKKPDTKKMQRASIAAGQGRGESNRQEIKVKIAKKEAEARRKD